MKKKFKWIAIAGYPRHSSSFLTHRVLYSWLIKKGYEVFIEYNISKILNIKNSNIATLMDIGKKCDLAIIVGGDGNMLCVARILSYYPIKIIGVNRGNFGFLTDLNPDTVISMLSKILSGEYFLEDRFLLEACILNTNSSHLKKSIAINEVVLHPEKVTSMIKFEVYVDKKLAFYQRSDGLIISTPTGSTGYSLSAGGPILFTLLDAIVIIPMFPHTLSSRPIVLNNNSIISLKVFDIEKKVQISCDGQVILPLNIGDKIIIRKSKHLLKLIHPKSYNYFNILNSKLKWSKSFF